MNTPVRSSRIGKTLYGFLFVVVVPALLVLWAEMTGPYVHAPVPGSLRLGVITGLTGFVIMIAGMAALIMYGNGLPMNPYPPRFYVSRGIYRLISHPIYAGFSLLSIGSAIALRSSSGLWLVSPLLILGCASLVQGYEKQDLIRRLGPALPKPLISLPANEARVPTIAERVSVYVLVLFPWLVLYEAVSALGIPPDAIRAYFAFEKHLPVYEWTEIVYGSTYLFVFLAPLVARSARSLREFSVAGLAGTGLVTLLFIAVPFIAPPREFTPQGFLGSVLMQERSLDTAAAAFPSFHVVWAFLAARVYAQAMPSWRLPWRLFAVLISLSCITTGMHAIVDVIGGLVVVAAVSRIDTLWESVRRLTERIANSWKEWRIGPVRIINHGMYGGAGTFIGLLIVCTLLGPDYVGPASIAAFSALIMAALWAQYIEGSPSLLRPYGFYGGVLGVILGSLAAPLFGASTWLLLGAYSVAGPWVQAAGRLRCLVQGCCHGSEAPPVLGIRYLRPQSRVYRLANLAGVPVHPTPLYSIIWNVFTGIIVARLWSLHVSVTLVAGLYLILNGLGRFVEESYREEPQTPIIRGLRLYQWMAIVSTAAGAIVTTVDASVAVPAPAFSLISFVAAAGFGLITWFALGVDFPKSNRRFSRLA